MGPGSTEVIPGQSPVRGSVGFIRPALSARTHVLKDSRVTAAHPRIKRTQAMSGALSAMLFSSTRCVIGKRTIQILDPDFPRLFVGN
jgi:hypothetical protein